MKEAESSSSPATIVACSAVSVVLLISLAVAIVEAVAAIKRKFSQPTPTPAGSINSKEDSLCRIGSCGHGGRLRPKKISLPEFTWLRHIRRCHTQNETNNNSTSTKITSIKEPLGHCKSLQESCAGKMDPLEENDVCWSPVTQVRQMGAVRFTANRRISTPVAPRKLTVSNSALRKLSECPCSQPSMVASSRHSAVVSNSFASLPITPGVARLCSSLTDILESNGPANGENPSLESDSSAGSSYRHTASLEPILMPTTALEARLKRVRLIRHR